MFSEIECGIFGYSKCAWHDDSDKNTYRAGEKYFTENFLLLGDSEGTPVELNAGEHKFDVSYALSSHLPTSFKCQYGKIKYKIQITIDRPWKLDSKHDFPFTVIRPLDLNAQENALRVPLKEEFLKNFKMDFTSDPLYVSASIPFSGYVPGQTITVMINVNNQSKTHVKEVKVSLKKIVLLNSEKPKKKTKMLVLSEAKGCTDPIGVQTKQYFEMKIIVPSLPPMISNCDAIKVFYELRVKAVTSGLSSNPKLKIPVMIGTVPLETRGDNIPASPGTKSLRKKFKIKVVRLIL